ncbi:MAG TPA: SurA N-terminal domain-containing protein [Lysobacter sp.]|nr:SurA N-terminal domain-containing protein [Lysobacter sp.]
MLQKLREKTSGWIATVILGLLIVPFALVGVNEYLVQRADTSLARIDAPPSWWPDAPSWWPMSMLWEHEQVTAEEFRERMDFQRQRMREMMGEQFDPREFDTPDNKRRVLDQLVDERMARIAARRAGLAVSDALVRKAIAETPAFQVDGRFNSERYLQLLVAAQPPFTPRSYEARVREDLERVVLTGAVGGSSFVTPTELKRVVELLGETRDVALVTLPAPAPDAGAVSEAEMQQWHRTQGARYRVPQQIWIEYVELNAADVPAPVLDEAALRQRYEQDKNRFAAAEERLASHILVRVPEGASAAQQKEAEAKIRRIAAEAKAPGADFAALAQRHSDDASKAQGGDLGWLGKGATVPEFEKALFALKPGQVSEPVKTEFGWHLIQLRELRGGQMRPFEEVREQLVAEQLQNERERAYTERSSQLVDATLKNPSSLAPAARQLNLPVHTLGPVRRGEPNGIMANPNVQRVAFSDTLIQDGTVSDPIEIGPSHIVLLRVTRHEPERVPPLAQVRNRVIADIRADRTRKAAERRADALLAKLRGGATLEAVATEQGVGAPEVVAGVRRGVPVPTAEASEAVFAVPAPAAGKPSFGRVVLDDGQAVLFAVTAARRGRIDELSPMERASVTEPMTQEAGNRDVEALLKALRTRMKVTINEANL